MLFGCLYTTQITAAQTANLSKNPLNVKYARSPYAAAEEGRLHHSSQHAEGERKMSGQFTDGVRPGWERRGLHRPIPRSALAKSRVSSQSGSALAKEAGQQLFWPNSRSTAGHHAPGSRDISECWLVWDDR